MTMYLCKLCPNKTYHPGRWACPKEGAYDPGKVARVSERKTAARKILSGDTPIPGGQPSPGATGGAPAPAPTPKGLVGVELGTQIAETARRDDKQSKANEEWVLPEESSVTFYGTFRDAMRAVAKWADDMLDAKHTEEGEIKDSVFEMGAHELSAAKGGFARRFATRVVKALGAQTLEEGIATVDTMAFGVMFGGMFLQVIGHFIKVAMQSPRLKKMRDRAKEKAKARDLAKEEARLTAEQKAGATTTTGRPVPGAA